MSADLAGASPPSIETRGLTRRFGGLCALDHLDLTVARGEAIAVFGANGAGKTTLLRLLTGALRPTGGSVRVAGLDPRRHERAVRRLFGVVAHPTFLYEALSAHENLTFFARLYGLPDPAGRARRLLASVGLEARWDEPIRVLSRGMQQRTALARALLHDPEILLLDEPFTGLDPQGSAWLLATLGALRRQGRTLLLVTHDPARGAVLSDRWILLARGRLVGRGGWDGPQSEALSRALIGCVPAPADRT